ncbi:Rne/Rng family ribonuclease [Saccharibacter floricola]|uniref:Ribonuclease E n=1 Tax=Saccharibacter floricola DSM 15669 TaxID=1123227 RepID=A0ABQ0NZR3_9PROT|nr:ribonuclease E/G [Saccharibacter floricola]GBQ07603.1 ribonuclease E [Saccharibacter floricola DSM 15669]
MTKQMLIDATHAEETRVVVMNNKHIDDYDVETSARRQLKGNIYLAKVIRVEPSLQAAFVDYGGNRHGFLAFSEIHPDYFQIPVADREKLLELQEEEYAAEQRGQSQDELDSTQEDEQTDGSDDDDHHPEIVSGEHDTGEEQTASRRTARFLRNYRIQEVIRRRQIILVQVVKEERGNKGAALTTYVSLAGRYGVLMPNALRGGGVSRKITSDTDRKRLREIVSHLNLPRSMAMIIRTAGAGRPEAEITRDCDYLLQLWDDIRQHALTSVAPALVYEEASLIKRAIRDLFTRDIESVYVDGEAAWKNAREFTRLLMPNNANRIRLWQNRGQSLFSHYHVESHLDAMFSPTVRLESGGYLVINQTEALVAIDVNSGKSTSQRNVEDTALRTNMEAAEEVARQLRLRDLAGLIVIDFIDMESRRHNNQVEKRLKDSLRLDRARIQIGRISHFGLLEMSRQRLRPSLAESMLSPCPHCQGTGTVRGVESTALHVLRSIEEEACRQRAAELAVHVSPNIVLYMLNSKRVSLAELEKRHNIKVTFEADDSFVGADNRIDRVRPRQVTRDLPAPAPAPQNADHVRTIEIVEGEAPESSTTTIAAAPQHAEENDNNPRRRRTRRRRRSNTPQDVQAETLNPENHQAVETTSSTEPTGEPKRDEGELMPGRRRTRVRRVASSKKETDAAPSDKTAERKTRRKPELRKPKAYQGPTPADPFQGFDIFDAIEQTEAARAVEAAADPSVAEEAPQAKEEPTRRTRHKRSTRNKKTDVSDVETTVPTETDKGTQQAEESPAPTQEETPAPKTPRRRRRTRKTEETAPAVEPVAQTEEPSPAPTEEEPAKEAAKPVRKRRTTRRKKTEAETAPQEEVAAPQPINVDEAKPAKRRVGWWKR